MTVGELFCGIGGIGLGLERAGMEVRWAIDNDPYACAVYRKNFPHVEVIKQDITTVDFTELESVDLLAGGFPCQDISVAGEGRGIEGEKSGLWSEYRRAICLLRPRLAFVENVPAITFRGLDTILGDLTALGYGYEGTAIPAGAFGAPILRWRYFLVAWTNGEGLERSIFPRESLRFTERSASAKFGDRSVYVGPWWGEHGEHIRMDTRFSPRLDVDRIRCLGNAVVPQVAEWIGRRIMEVYGP